MHKNVVWLAVFACSLGGCGGSGDENHAPTTGGASVTLAEDASATAITVTAADRDNDPLTLTILTAPTKGALVVAGANTFTYTPAANQNGADQFTYRVTDPGGLSADGSVSITITPIDDGILPVDDQYVIPATGTTTLRVTANDVDVDNEVLTVSTYLPHPGLDISVNGDSFQVTPQASVSGPTSFMYRVSDPVGNSTSATVRVIVGSAMPLFLRGPAAAANGAQMYRYDYFAVTPLLMPEIQGAPIEKFATSANGHYLVVATVGATLPTRHRLWLKDLRSPASLVREVPVPPNFYANYLRVSPDGATVVFNDSYVRTAASDVLQEVDSGGIIERPTFTRDGRRLFYSVLMAGGGRIIKRADVAASGELSNRVPMTADYPVAQGLGIDFTLTPDETKIVSQGLIFPFGAQSLQSQAFVTIANGSRIDTRLHPAFTTNVDHVGQPKVTADGRYAYYVATLNGVTGLFSTELNAPGTSLRLDSPPGYVEFAQAAAGSNTLFLHQMTSLLPLTRAWFLAAVDQFIPSTGFNPLGGAFLPPRALAVAPDGSAVVFDSRETIYLSPGPTFSTASVFLPGNSIPTTPVFTFAPDSNSLVYESGFPGQALGIMNSRVPGWGSNLMVGGSTVPQVTCYAFAGGGC